MKKDPAIFHFYDKIQVKMDYYTKTSSAVVALQVMLIYCLMSCTMW